MSTGGSTAIGVVVVCYDSAGEVAETLRALRPQLRAGDEIVAVDNASTDATLAAIRVADPDAMLVVNRANLGFAGGCHAGVGATAAGLLLFLNPDAIPAPGFVGAMRRAAEQHPDWGSWQALVTLPGGEIVNTAGNLVHWLGFGWAGGMGKRVAEVAGEDSEVPFASGAALVVRREAWDAVGGFDRRYFMYGEDLDLSLRLRLAGWRIGVAPDARVAHDYSFAKGDYKWFYLERNRWWTLLTDYPASLLAIVLPPLLAFEAALLFVAWRGGWLRAKLRAQAAVLRAIPAILRRRREVQATRSITPAAFASWLTPSLESPYLAEAHRVPGLVAAQARFWRVARATLR